MTEGIVTIVATEEIEETGTTGVIAAASEARDPIGLQDHAETDPSASGVTDHGAHVAIVHSAHVVTALQVRAATDRLPGSPEMTAGANVPDFLEMVTAVDSLAAKVGEKDEVRVADTQDGIVMTVDHHTVEMIGALAVDETAVDSQKDHPGNQSPK